MPGVDRDSPSMTWAMAVLAVVSNPVMPGDMRQFFQRGRRPPSQRIPTLEQRTDRSSTGVYWYRRLRATAELS